MPSRYVALAERATTALETIASALEILARKARQDEMVNEALSRRLTIRDDEDAKG